MDFFIANNGNEKELIEIAKKFNINNFVLLYDSIERYKSAKLFNFADNFDCFELEHIKKGIILKKPDLKEISKAVSVSDYVVVKAFEDLRKLIEKSKNIFIYNVESCVGNDFIHFRNSDMNQILAKLAFENNIKFLFNFFDFLKLDNKKKALVLGRLKQNMILYDKLGVKFYFASFAKNKFDIKFNFQCFQNLIKTNKIELSFKNI